MVLVCDPVDSKVLKRSSQFHRKYTSNANMSYFDDLVMHGIYLLHYKYAISFNSVHNGAQNTEDESLY